MQNDIAASDDISAHLRDLVAKTVKNLKTLGGVGSSGAGAGVGGAPAKREIRGVHLNMDNLLGKKAEEDQYIKALLLVDGVTSVTIDRVRATPAAAACASVDACLSPLTVPSPPLSRVLPHPA
jgi:hypothetical protein